MTFVSVVICTYNRAHTIAETLRSLQSQVYRNFEVIVVMGPCTDNTEQIIEKHSDWLRTYKTHLRNLSVSRNIGIENALGDVVAFIDDDGIADPRWLSELIEPYSDPAVGGVGGLVYDHTGVELQYRYSACYRRGETTFNISPPFDDLVMPGADPFLYIQGTNSSFRTESLRAIGGFNEDIEYYHDETDVCMRLIDSGYKIKSLDRACVIHRYAPSHIRNHERLVLDPYTTVKNQHLFALQNGRYSQSLRSVHSYLAYYTGLVAEGARWNFRRGNMTANQFEYFMQRLEQGVLDGVVAGNRPRNSRNFSAKPPLSTQLIPQPTPQAEPLNIVFLSQEYPPYKIGGIGRFTRDLAEELARQGHIVHVVTRGDKHTIDYANGVYLHMIEFMTPSEQILEMTPAAWNLAHQFSIYNYLLSIENRFSIDVVSAPIWLCEGLLAHVTKRWPNVLTLHTTMKTIVDLHPEEAARPENRALMALEKLAFDTAQCVQANSQAVLNKSCSDYSSRSDAYVIPHGIGPDDLGDTTVHAAFAQHLDPDLTKVLFVGRVELRKGADILLDSIATIFPIDDRPAWPPLQFIIAGQRSLNTGLGVSFEEWFTSLRPDIVLSKRVLFVGELTSEELAFAYRSADLFVLPSRFESFGLVLLEALRAGLPVIAANTSGMSEVVRPEYGVLFEPDVPGDLAARLLALAGDAPTINAMKAAAGSAIENYFNMASIASQISDKYREAIESQNVIGRFSFQQESVSIAYHLSKALDLDIWQARAICDYFSPSTSLKLRLERLVDLLVNGTSVQFFSAAYLTLLGRPYEDHLDEAVASAAIAHHGGRIGFSRKLLMSQEAMRLVGWKEMHDQWCKLTGDA